ncbi:MAG: MFS transporter [Ignavibacteria bacterium GWB2_35_6b]|nr:MAG: MFS transporter [Ignavibacteria bacterium GWB2_35_6b]
MKLKTIPIFLAFLAMGFGDAVGPFVGLAKNEFALSNTMAYMIPFMGFIMFGLLSVPMGIFQDKKGKKFILLLGLAIMMIGLVIPMFGLSSFVLFLFTVLLLGAGATILQVAGNPIMRDVSAEGKYSRNLSLAQFVKAVGSLTGPVIPAVAAAWFAADWKILFPIYTVLLLITLVSVSSLKVEEKKDEGAARASLGSSLALLKNKYILMMVLAIFLYVGAEVCMSSGIPLYLESEFGINIAEFGLLGTGLFFTTLMIGRFLGGTILNWISPQKFFLITSIISIAAVLGLFTGNSTIAVISVILLGLGFANIFPLVFSITVDAMPEKTNELSGLMVTAIVGGAIVPPIMGIVADSTSTLLGFVVPLTAVIYIGWTSLVNLKKA